VIQGESFVSVQGGPRPAGAKLGYITKGDSATYSVVDFSKYSSVSVRYTSAGAGGVLELRRGSTTGPIVQSLNLTNTGGWTHLHRITNTTTPNTPTTDTAG